MSASDIRSESRRRFLKFLSGSPLLAYPGLGTIAADGPTAPPRLSDPILWAPLRTEDATKARGVPIWFQLYASPSWDVARALIKRAEAAGCPVLVVTVDRVAGRNQETLFRLRREDTRNCQDCHQPGIVARARRRPNY